jgi:hypothetical protein
MKVGAVILLSFLLGVLVKSFPSQNEDVSDTVILFDLPCTLIELPTEQKE